MSFNIDRNGSVPIRDMIKRWVQNFRTTASAVNLKSQGRVSQSVRTPDSVKRVRQAIIESPQRCLKRAALRMSNGTLRRILH